MNIKIVIVRLKGFPKEKKKCNLQKNGMKPQNWQDMQNMQCSKGKNKP